MRTDKGRIDKDELVGVHSVGVHSRISTHIYRQVAYAVLALLAADMLY